MSIGGIAPHRIVFMRFAISLLVALSLTAPALGQSREACEMATPDLLASALGQEYEIYETQNPAPGMSFCAWKGQDRKIINIHSVTAESEGIDEDQAVEAFNIYLAVQKEQLPGYVHELEGPWQSAYIIEDANEATNPDHAFCISFVNKGDSVTVQTAFVGRDIAIGLAEKVAEGM
jgi:hypothetical protein